MSVPGSFMPVPNHWESTHFRAVTIDKQKFVYCPVGNIVSWHPGDFDNTWCPWCKQYFSEIRAEQANV